MLSRSTNDLMLQQAATFAPLLTQLQAAMSPGGITPDQAAPIKTLMDSWWVTREQLVQTGKVSLLDGKRRIF